MGLTEYKKKRSFEETPEPTGGKAAGRKLHFVIQKHAASRLHYDFRLELNGVLKSWAVPKGPSIKPSDKRLAMLVEDHPFDYKNFEGIIPEGNYGAGTVIIWDEGTYEPLESVASKSEQEKLMAKQFDSGALKFRLHGHKLNGEFALVKMKGREANAWLLIKHRDQFAGDEDITQQEGSVVSGKTIEELASSSTAKQWRSNRAATKKSARVSKATRTVAPKKAVKRKTVTPSGPAKKKARSLPSFRGLREDKEPKAVKMEKAVAAETIVDTDRPGLDKKIITSVAKKGERKTLLNPKDETQVRSLNGHELKFTNLSKLYWPDEGYTKRDMLNYYYQVTPYMLPYMKGRPQTLNRFPNGINGPSFYQKDVTGKVSDWVEKYKYFSEGDQREKHFMVCTNEASLLYIASLGCIEMNPWSSTTESPDNPDWCVIDLDPDKRNTFNQVIEAALVTKEVLDALKIPGYCKTSGSTGLHIYIPLAAKYTYEDSKEFARALVKIVYARIPSFTTIERKVSDRNGKMYLDFLQNRPQATLAGPYSLRPKPGAPVSMPLDWSEVKKGLKITDFNIANAIPRLRETGDLFKGVLGKGIDLSKVKKAMDDAFLKAR